MVALSTTKINPRSPGPSCPCHIRRPDYGTMPRWMRSAVRDAIRAGRLPEPEPRTPPISRPWYALLYAAGCCGGTWWIDHEGRLVEDTGEQVLVSEPYQLSAESEAHLARFCAALNLTYHVEPSGWWRGGMTLRIVVRQGQEQGQEVAR